MTPQSASLRAPLLSEKEEKEERATSASKRDLLGIGLMLCSEFLNACVNGLVKEVAGWPTERLMLVRFTIDMVVSLIVARSRRHAVPGAQDVPWLFMRGAAYCAGLICFWGGLQSCLPLGDVVVTVIALSPLILTVLAWLLLSEAIPRTWPPQMVLCVTGALLINKPLAPAPDCPVPTLLLPFGAAFFWSLMNLVVRRISHVPPPLISAFTDVTAIILACGAALTKTGGAASAAAALLLPSTLDRSLCLACVAAITGWGGTQCNIAGYQRVSVAAVAAVAGSTSVPFNYAVQIFVFGDAPDSFAVFGAAMIVATNLMATLAKYRVSTGAASSAAAALKKAASVDMTRVVLSPTPAQEEGVAP